MQIDGMKMITVKQRSSSSYGIPGSDSVAATNELSTQSSSNNVKWDEINDPLVNKAMKDKLKASVDAIVQKDVDAFHKTLSPDIGSEHDYLLDNPVKFTALGKAVEENGRILVPVKGENQRTDSNGAEMTYTFYFEKDKSGEWQIVVID
ncbi:hypothetical protein A3842_14485 [Paenibacillus sp. P3E]|nr:hypothetical protein A3842_14485 [Paenibacillus sp. P3E]